MFEWIRRTFAPNVTEQFFDQLIESTDNFGHVTWLGRPIWQNVFDLWVMQETIAEVKPAILIETGTHQGGSALFFAHLFELMGHGIVVSIDVEKKHDLAHSRVVCLTGSSVAPEIVANVQSLAQAAGGPVLVTLDSDHSEKHVSAELAAYARLVTPGSYIVVQDGVIDVLPRFAAGRPGPLPAIDEFLRHHPEFKVDEARSRKFLISHHPKGWLRRVK
jgi:cephalosporin hydroxylase